MKVLTSFALFLFGLGLMSFVYFGEIGGAISPKYTATNSNSSSRGHVCAPVPAPNTLRMESLRCLLAALCRPLWCKNSVVSRT
jgi:hypothetical protein